MDVPGDRHYTREHEWVDTITSPVRVGITAFAADALGDVVWIDVPAPGTELVHGQVCGEIESTKSVSDLYAPASGVVVEVNDRLDEEPALVNREPYDGGWLFTMTVTATGELLDATAYREVVS